MSKTIIEIIQEDDPNWNPLTDALRKTPFIGPALWKAACDRVYMDGYYGPLSDSDWEEQDGRKPYSVSSAMKIIAKVLDNVEPYKVMQYCDDLQFDPDVDENDLCEDECIGHETERIDASDIKAALIPWYKEIYGVRFP